MVDWKDIGKRALDVTKGVTEKGIDSLQEWKDDPERLKKVAEKKSFKESSKIEKIEASHNKKMNKKLRKQNLNVTFTILNRSERDIKKVRKFPKALASTLFQQYDGKLYFDNDTKQLFSLINYFWEGPVYKDISETVTTDRGNSGLGGAVLGGIVGGNTGAIVGAIAGKSNDSTSKTIHHKDVEQPALAKMTLKDLKTKKEMTIEFLATTSENSIIKKMMGDYADNLAPRELNLDDISIKLTKLKQLLDEGILTQEEFDVKKKQLLNLDQSEDDR